jgi:hypothetical protein
MATNNGPEREFLLPWLCSAAIMTVFRLLYAADLGYDLTYQIQASQNLLAGKGLTVYRPTSDNLADPLALITLTFFPAGYSLCAALLMVLGAGPGTVVKVMGATASMLGWWGWAKLAWAYMGEGWQRGGVWKGVGYFIAIVSPLLFTIPWSGTDILLWAGVPWVLRYVVRSPDLRSQGFLRMDVAAGALTGLCMLMRYASLFLVLYAGFLIVCQCRLRMVLLVRRAAAFGFGLFPAFAVQSYVNYYLATRAAAQDRVSGGFVTASTRALDGLDHLTTRALDGLDHLTTASFSVLFWLPGQILDPLTGTAYRPLLFTITSIVLALPAVVAVARNAPKTSSASYDLALAGAGLFIMVPLFLLAAQAADGTPYGVVPRYYGPLLPLALFIAYSLATMDTQRHRQRITLLLRLTGQAYLAAFMISSVVLIVFLPVRGTWRIVGTAVVRPWPSLRLTYDDSPARRYVMGVLKARPGVVFIAAREQWFFADPEVDQSRIHRIERCGVLRATHIGGPARLLVLANSQGFYWSNELGGQAPRRAPCYERLPLRVLQRFPDEELEVLEGEIPDGVRVTLKDVPGSSS